MLQYIVSLPNSDILWFAPFYNWRRPADDCLPVEVCNIPLMTINRFIFPSRAKYSLLSVPSTFWHIFVTVDATEYSFELDMLVVYDLAKCKKHSSADCAWKERSGHTGAIDSSAIDSFGGVLLKITKAVSSNKMNEKVLHIPLIFTTGHLPRPKCIKNIPNQFFLEDKTMPVHVLKSDLNMVPGFKPKVPRSLNQ